MTKPPQPRPRAAIFDLDGTLIDSMTFVVDALIYAVEPFRSRPTAEEVLSNLGGPLDTCLRNVLGAEAAGSFDEAKRRLASQEHGHGQEERLTPFDGAKDLLVRLRGAGAGLGIWTGRDRWSAERMLAVHGFAPLIDTMVCGDDLPTHKPDPEGLLEVVRRLGVRAGEAVFMGDADVDVEGGHAAGVLTIFVHHGRVAPAHIHQRAAEVYAGTGEAYASVARHFGL